MQNINTSSKYSHSLMDATQLANWFDDVLKSINLSADKARTAQNAIISIERRVTDGYILESQAKDMIETVSLYIPAKIQAGFLFCKRTESKWERMREMISSIKSAGCVDWVEFNRRLADCDDPLDSARALELDLLAFCEELAGEFDCEIEWTGNGLECI